MHRNAIDRWLKKLKAEMHTGSSGADDDRSRSHESDRATASSCIHHQSAGLIIICSRSKHGVAWYTHTNAILNCYAQKLMIKYLSK